MKIRKFNLLIFLLAFLVLIPTFQIAFSQTTSTFWLTSGIYPNASHYTFYEEGNVYYAKNKWGRVDYSGTNITSVWESARGQLDPDDMVSFKGGFTLTAPIVVGNHTTLDLRQAYFEIGANYNDCMLTNEEQFSPDGTQNNNIRIWGGNFDGNKANQASGGIMNFENVSELQIYNSFLIDGKEYGLRLHDVFRSHVNIISIDVDGEGFYLRECGQVTGTVHMHGCDTGLYVYDSEELNLAGSIYGGSYYTNNAIVAVGNSRNNIFDFTISYCAQTAIRLVQTIGLTLRGSSSYNKYHGLRIEGSNHTKVDMMLSSNGLETADTYNDIFITNYNGDGSYYNRITVNAYSNNVDWNIQEGGNSNFNIIYNSITTETKGIQIAGANTTVVDCYNGTVWIGSP